MKKLLLVLFTFHLSLFISAQTDSLRTIACYWTERGYYARSIAALRQIPQDSLTLDDMQQHYLCLSSMGQEDSLIYWAEKILKGDPYCVPIILDYTKRLNKGIKTEMGKLPLPERVIDICEQYKQHDSTHILINRNWLTPIIIWETTSVRCPN